MMFHGAKYMQLTVAILVCLTTGVGASDAEGKDPSGSWRWEHDDEGQEINNVLQLYVDEGGKLLGTYGGYGEPVDISAGKIDGDHLAVEFSIERNGESVDVAIEGEFADDEIEGTVTLAVGGDTMDFPWSAERSVVLSDITGEWQMLIEADNGMTLKPTLNVSIDGDKVKKTYTSTQGDQLPVTDLKIEKNRLRFTVTADINGTELTANYNGRAYGPKMSGVISYEMGGQTGEVEFTGKRKAAEEDEG